MAFNWKSLLVDVGRSVLRDVLRNQSSSTRRQQSGRPSRAPEQKPGPRPSAGYPGDFNGRPTIEYSPSQDGAADPGEVVWGWVPFEEDHTQGKDRPVLLIGRDGEWLLGVPLTSKDHDRDAGQEASQGRFWMDVGTGPWDRRQRPSEARLDRVVRLSASDVRRTGAAMDRDVFDRVTRGILDHAR